MDNHPKPRLAIAMLALLASAKLIMHLIAIDQYGYFRDELYYLACAEHLDWGYVDHPPFSIAILAAVRALLGDSLITLRMVPVLTGSATVFIAGVLARQLGGGRFAQALTALAMLMAPVVAGLGHVYSMNALDLLIWTVTAWALLLALDQDRPRHWMVLGAVLGLGLLNKISVLWLGGGIFIGLLLTPHRRMLRTPWPWAAALVAFTIFLPHLFWQVQQDWPTIEFMRNATSIKMAAISVPGFLGDQLLVMNPASAPVWIAGIFFGLFARDCKQGRVFVWIYLTVLVLLLVSGRSRASYLVPAYPMLLALGAVAVERVSAAPGRRWIQTSLAAVIIAFGLVQLPFAIPVLPVETFVRYQSALGMSPHTEEQHAMGSLPQQYADMFGWEELAGLVAEAYQQLSPEEQLRCRIFAQNYGQAGAIDFIGRKLGLPHALSGHNSYWLWGPGDAECDVMIIIGGEREDNAEFFEEIEIVGQTRSPWSMPYERGLDVSIARRPKMRLRDVWPKLKSFI